jgi:hypothetical protein
MDSVEFFMTASFHQFRVRREVRKCELLPRRFLSRSAVLRTSVWLPHPMRLLRARWITWALTERQGSRRAIGFASSEKKASFHRAKAVAWSVTYGIARARGVYKFRVYVARLLYPCVLCLEGENFSTVTVR